MSFAFVIGHIPPCPLCDAPWDQCSTIDVCFKYWICTRGHVFTERELLDYWTGRRWNTKRGFDSLARRGVQRKHYPPSDLKSAGRRAIKLRKR